MRFLSRLLVPLTLAAAATMWVPVAAATPGPEPAGTGSPRPGFAWPTGHPAAVTRPFAPPAKRWLPGHRGVDLASAAGRPIYAPADGVVVFVGEVAHMPVVSIQHASGVRFTLQPVRGDVTEGERVRAGARVGTLEGGHGSEDLSFGARVGRDRYLNPLAFVVGRVILKPAP